MGHRAELFKSINTGSSGKINEERGGTDLKRILFLINTLNVGGAEHVLTDIANRLADNGLDITVQTIFDSGYYRDLLSNKVKYQGGSRVSTGLLNALLYRILCAIPSGILHKLLIKSSYDYEIAFLEGLPTKVIAGCKRKKVKKIAWVHTDLYNFYRNRYVFGSVRANRKCYEKYNNIVCVSNDARLGFIKRMGDVENLTVRYNPLNKCDILRKASDVPAYSVAQNEAFRFVAVGRLVEVKGFDMLIEAIGNASTKLTVPIELYIVGSGEEEAKLKQIIQSKELSDIVHLCGQHSNPYSIMKCCDAQVVSSRAEGYPLVLCEGHLLGLPAIATKCAGPSEIIEESRAGLLVDATVEGLTNGIVKLVTDRDLYAQLKSNAQMWSDNYHVDSVYQKIESVFL